MVGSAGAPGLAAVTVAFAWPSVLVLNLLWGPDRRRQFATTGAYLAAVVLLCLLSGLSAVAVLYAAVAAAFLGDCR